jgi:hypothetical protein
MPPQQKVKTFNEVGSFVESSTAVQLLFVYVARQFQF